MGGGSTASHQTGLGGRIPGQAEVGILVDKVPFIVFPLGLGLARRRLDRYFDDPKPGVQRTLLTGLRVGMVGIGMCTGRGAGMGAGRRGGGAGKFIQSSL